MIGINTLSVQRLEQDESWMMLLGNWLKVYNIMSIIIIGHWLNFENVDNR